MARHGLRQAWWVVGLLALTASAACGGGSDQPAPEVEAPTAEARQPVSLTIVTSDLVVGPNRFTFVLFDAEGQPVDDIEGMRARFYDLTGAEAVLSEEVPVRRLTIELETSEVRGIYVMVPTFTAAGQWGVEPVIPGVQTAAALRVSFTVREESLMPSNGDPAPRTDNPTIDDVDDVRQVDSAVLPKTELHRLSIADAVTSGKPSVIAFVTPAFCTSRLCGPVADVVQAVAAEYYGDRVNFVAVEPYRLDEEGQPEGGQLVLNQWAQEWNLQVEPIIFLVDRQGIVRGVLEGITTPEELAANVEALLAIP